MPEKRKKLQTVMFSNPVSPLPCSQDSSSLHHTIGRFCTITRVLLTYMEMLHDNRKLPLPSCPLYAPVRVCVPECVFLHACPLCALGFSVQRELLALMFSDAGKC